MKDTTDNAHVTVEWIRRPLDELGGVSPADAVTDADKRRKLDDLLVELAGHHVRLTNLGLPAVNPADIRKALGIEAAVAAAPRAPARVVRPGPIKRNQLLDELGTALTGGDVDSVAYYNLKGHAVEHFMHNLGDQENVRIAEADTNPDMKKIAPVTTEVRYGIMSDFIGLVEDINVAGRLRTAISGKGAFRRFREAVDEDDTLRRRWLGYRTKRHYHLALDWLHANGLKPEGINASDYDWEPPAHDAAVATHATPSAATPAAPVEKHAEAAAPETAEAAAPETADAAAPETAEAVTAAAAEQPAEAPPATNTASENGGKEVAAPTT
jgi:hypothetical protein